MDDADRAEEYQEVALESAIAAVLSVKPTPGNSCRECDEPLMEHRRPYGICWACQSRLESRMRRGLIGV